MNFEWDAAKAALNLQKHGITFEDAEYVFSDVARIEAYDGRESYGEDRWFIIGLAYAAVLFVVYTVREGESYRIISARKANDKERKRYYQTQF